MSNQYISLESNSFALQELESKVQVVLSTGVPSLKLTGTAEIGSGTTTGKLRYNDSLSALQYSNDGGTTWNNLNSDTFVWNQYTTYAAGAVVIYQTGWYYCLESNLNSTPTTSTKWALLTSGSLVRYVTTQAQLVAALQASATNITIIIKGTISDQVAPTITASTVSIYSDETTEFESNIVLSIPAGGNVYWHANGTVFNAGNASITASGGTLWIDRLTVASGSVALGASVRYQRINGTFTGGVQDGWLDSKAVDCVPKDLSTLSEVAYSTTSKLYVDSGDSNRGTMSVGPFCEAIAADAITYLKVDGQGTLVNRPTQPSKYGYIYYATDNGNIYIWLRPEGTTAAHWSDAVRIKGDTGETGTAGANGWTVAPAINTTTGVLSWTASQSATTPTPPSSIKITGDSAYEIWLKEGHTGTEADFLEWLRATFPDVSVDGKYYARKDQAWVDVSSVINYTYVYQKTEVDTLLTPKMQAVTVLPTAGVDYDGVVYHLAAAQTGYIKGHQYRCDLVSGNYVWSDVGITVDATPTEASTNVITSGAVYTGLAGKLNAPTASKSIYQVLKVADAEGTLTWEKVKWGELENVPTTFTPAAHNHADATTSAAGFMSAADKTKLDGLSTPGDGTITITQGDSTWSFTVNQSTNTSIELEEGGGAVNTVDATTYRVWPNTVAVPAGAVADMSSEVQTMLSTVYGSRVLTETIKEAIPIQSTERFYLLSTNSVDATSDVSVDWGDGSNLSKIANGATTDGYYAKDTTSSSAYTIYTMSHTYAPTTTTSTYEIHVYGKGYHVLRHCYDTESADFTCNLVCGVFERTGSLASHLTNCSSMFRWCLRLFYIDAGYNYPFVHARNISNMFFKCRNLFEVQGLGAPPVGDTSAMFMGCSALRYSSVGIWDMTPTCTGTYYSRDWRRITNHDAPTAWTTGTTAVNGTLYSYDSAYYLCIMAGTATPGTDAEVWVNVLNYGASYNRWRLALSPVLGNIYLVDSDYYVSLSGINTYQSPDDEETNVYSRVALEMYKYCPSLEMDIAELIPRQRNPNRSVALYCTFLGCNKLYGTVPAEVLWDDDSTRWYVYHAFEGCTQLYSQIPNTNGWGGTMAYQPPRYAGSTTGKAIERGLTDHETSTFKWKPTADSSTVNSCTISLGAYEDRYVIGTTASPIAYQYMRPNSIYTESGELLSARISLNVGTGNTAGGWVSLVVGCNNTVGDMACTATGILNKVTGQASSVEGYNNTITNANYAHAEGQGNTVTANECHAEGAKNSITGGEHGHAEGKQNTVSANGAHAEGLGNIARVAYQHVEGKYNVADTAGTYQHIVGNGTENARANIQTLDWNGNLWVAGSITDGSGNVLSNKADTDDIHNGKLTITQGSSTWEFTANQNTDTSIELATGTKKIIQFSRAASTNVTWSGDVVTFNHGLSTTDIETVYIRKTDSSDGITIYNSLVPYVVDADNIQFEIPQTIDLASGTWELVMIQGGVVSDQTLDPSTYATKDYVRKLDYSAFEVYPNSTDIAAGTVDEDTNIAYPVAVSAAMTEGFHIRSDHDQDVTDVVVEWGDGSTTKVADLAQEYVNRTTDADTEEITYNLVHTYTTAGKYVVKILGNKYWGLSYSTAATNLISRIFDSDLPIASCVQNLSGLCNSAVRLQGVNIPTGMRMFANIVNAANLFYNCTNLIYLNNFETKFAVIRTVQAMCSGCINLLYSDCKLPIANPYKYTASGAPSVKSMYCNCSKLGTAWVNLAGNTVTTTIESLFPFGGFTCKAVNMTDCFKNCAALTGTIPMTYLWADSNMTFTATDCFTGCTQLASQAPVSWGGTNSSLDTMIANHAWNYIPVSTTSTIGGVKVDGVTITISDGVITAVNQGGGGGGGSLPSADTTLFDSVSIYAGNDNTVGGYSVKIKEYSPSDTAGATYFIIDSIANEAEDVTSIDWDTLTIGTTMYIMYASNGENYYKAVDIYNTDSSKSKIFIQTKLSETTAEYTIASGTYVTGKIYASGTLNTTKGRYVYTDLVEGTDWTAGETIGSNIFLKTSTTTVLTAKELAGGYIAVRKSRGTDVASYTFGTMNASNGNLSYVVGNNNRNAGTCTCVTGYGNIVAGEMGLVAGAFNQVGSQDTFVFGTSNIVDYNSFGSFIFGNSNESITSTDGNSQANVVFGGLNKTHAVSSFVFGNSNETYGNYNFVFGDSNKPYGKFSVVVGQQITNKCDSCISIGHKYTVDDNYQYGNSLVFGDNNISFAVTTKRKIPNPEYIEGGTASEYTSCTAYGVCYKGRLKPDEQSIAATGTVTLDHDIYSRWDITTSGAVTIALSNWLNGDRGELVVDNSVTTITFPQDWIVPSDFMSGTAGVKVIEIAKERGNIYAHVLIPFK